MVVYSKNSSLNFFVHPSEERKGKHYDKFKINSSTHFLFRATPLHEPIGPDNRENIKRKLIKYTASNRIIFDLQSDKFSLKFLALLFERLPLFKVEVPLTFNFLFFRIQQADLIRTVVKFLITLFFRFKRL